MKAAHLREKTEEDLVELRKALAHDIFENRLKNFTNRLDDTSAIRKTKRDLARVITLLHARELAAVSPEPPVAEESPKKKAAGVDKAPSAAKAAKKSEAKS